MERFFTVIQLASFTRAWERLGLTDEDLMTLEGQLREDPRGAPVIPGSGGARKARFAPPSWRRGKSGATRVVYAFVEVRGWIVLCAVYAKGEKSDLTPSELRELREQIDRAKGR